MGNMEDLIRLAGAKVISKVSALAGVGTFLICCQILKKKQSRGYHSESNQLNDALQHAVNFCIFIDGRLAAPA